MELLATRIQTTRLLLVPVSSGIREEIFRSFTEEITQYMRPQPSGDIKDTDAFIRTSRENMRKGSELVLAITNKDTGEFLGCAGIHQIDTRTPELGIWLKKEAHGNGYGKEVMRAMKDWTDENIDYTYLRYPVVKVNIPSRKLAESIGGKVAKEYVAKNQSGEDMDEVEYWIPSK